MSRIGFIVNPVAGSGSNDLALAAIRDEIVAAGHEPIDLSAASYDAARDQAAGAIARGQIDALLVAGGDGMMHLGTNLCAGTQVPLGLIAIGTGNDAARIFGLPIGDAAAGTREALSHLENPIKADAVRATSSTGSFWFFGTASAGFDALVNRRANTWSWPKGPIRYQLAMLREMVAFKPIAYKAVIDGKPREFEAMLCVIANNKFFGGGMMVVPHANIQDGSLELFIVHKISRIELIKVFPKVFTGRHVSHPAVEFVSAKSIRIEAAGMPVYADGEAVGQSPIDAQVAPAALLMLAKGAN